MTMRFSYAIMLATVGFGLTAWAIDPTLLAHRQHPAQGEQAAPKVSYDLIHTYSIVQWDTGKVQHSDEYIIDYGLTIGDCYEAMISEQQDHSNDMLAPVRNTYECRKVQPTS